MCTQMIVLSIFFFGGASLHYFALALTIGICFGIYSSVLVACPLAMYLGASREDFVKPEKKATETTVFRGICDKNDQAVGVVVDLSNTNVKPEDVSRQGVDDD